MYIFPSFKARPFTFAFASSNLSQHGEDDEVIWLSDPNVLREKSTRKGLDKYLKEYFLAAKAFGDE